MSRTAQNARLLDGAMADVWPVTARVVDVTNAERFPNIKAAVDYVASLSPERRAELWEK